MSAAIEIIEINNLPVLDFVKSPEITNSPKSKHAEINRSTAYSFLHFNQHNTYYKLLNMLKVKNVT